MWYHNYHEHNKCSIAYVCVNYTDVNVYYYFCLSLSLSSSIVPKNPTLSFFSFRLLSMSPDNNAYIIIITDTIKNNKIRMIFSDSSAFWMLCVLPFATERMRQDVNCVHLNTESELLPISHSVG